MSIWSHRIRSSLGLAFVVAALIPATLFAQTDATTEEAYWLQIEQLRDVVTGLDESGPLAVRTVLDAEAEKLTAIRSVSLQDGTVVPVNHSFIVGLLEQAPPDLAAIEDHLNALLAARQIPAASSPGQSSDSGQSPAQSSTPSPPSDSGPTLAEVLTRPEFQWQEEQPNPIREWLNNLIERLLDGLSKLLPSVGIIGGFSPLVLIIAGLILALILGFALRGLITDWVGAAEIHAEDERGQPLTAANALQRAQETASSGDYRTAVRFLYLSTLLQLEEHHLLRYDRARTNREYLRSVAHLPELAALLRDVVDVFDRVWYGYQSIDEESFQTFVARVTELRHYR